MTRSGEFVSLFFFSVGSIDMSALSEYLTQKQFQCLVTSCSMTDYFWVQVVPAILLLV